MTTNRRIRAQEAAPSQRHDEHRGRDDDRRDGADCGGTVVPRHQDLRELVSGDWRFGVLAFFIKVRTMNVRTQPIPNAPPARPGNACAAWRIDEDGAAYTLSYVMVIPVYALLICMIIETVLMLTAKLGTVYAAFAAARTASVWSSATTWDKTMTKAKAAATKSMTPFASGTHGGSTKAASPPMRLAYVAAYHAYAKKSDFEQVPARQVRLRPGAREGRDRQARPNIGTADITAKVTYEFPFNVPGHRPICRQARN